MSYRDWLPELKAATILSIALSVVLIIGWLISSERQKDQDSTRPIAAHQQPDGKSQKQPQLRIRAPGEEPDQTRPENLYPRAEDGLFWGDGVAQWIMALTGAMALILSAVAVWLLRSQLIATREAVRSTDDAVKETRRIGEAQVRAYVSWKSATIATAFYQETETLFALIFTPVIMNTGQSPAKLTSLYSYGALIDGDDPPIVRFDCEKAKCFDEIGSGNVFELVSQQMSKEDAVAVFSGKKRFYLMGWVSYIDVFQKENDVGHIISFCFEIIFRTSPANFTANTSMKSNIQFHSRPDFTIEPEH